MSAREIKDGTGPHDAEQSNPPCRANPSTSATDLLRSSTRGSELLY